MAYVTIAQLETHYGAEQVLQLSDRETSGTRQNAVLQSAIDRGAAAIDMALARCYLIPLAMADGSPVPSRILTTLEEWNGRIARYLLTKDVRQATPEAQASPEQVRYTEVMRILQTFGFKEGACAYFEGLVPSVKLQQAAQESAVDFGDEGSEWGRSDYQRPGIRRDVIVGGDPEW